MEFEQVFSTHFVEQWGKAYEAFYRYRREGNFLLVPSLSGKTTWSYLPGLTYTDVTLQDAEQLLNVAAGKHFTIRTLDPLKSSFKEDEPVTMRIGIAGKTKEEVLAKFDGNKRRGMQRADESGVVCKIGNDVKMLNDFFYLYTSTMHRHGSPSIAKGLIETLQKYIEVDIVVAYIDNIPAAALLIVYDNDIAWCPYGAADLHYSKLFPYETVYREAIFHAIDKQKSIFDCGRSPYGGGTYNFKKRLGAKAIGVSILKDIDEDIYSKYALASKIWQRLPKRLVDVLGPKLRKYIADS
ncbi:GNAT family N-acetyltransferase [Sulfuricurvum sp.]|uniref:GNAT family N-acetyltransferase n=1 Tax=Sulfuricurvum sp. TaxID=2025608 RepID=UPI003BB538F3